MEKHYWVKHVAGLALEGGSVPAYARAHGISADCLYYWRRKLNRAVVPLPSKVADHVVPNKFVALRVADTTNVAQRIASSANLNCALLIGDNVRLEMTALPTPEWLVTLAIAAQGVR